MMSVEVHREIGITQLNNLLPFKITVLKLHITLIPPTLHFSSLRHAILPLQCCLLKATSSDTEMCLGIFISLGALQDASDHGYYVGVCYVQSHFSL